MLVNGNHIELNNLLGRHVFFDQFCFLSMKFKIQAMLAIIKEKTLYLKLAK